MPIDIGKEMALPMEQIIGGPMQAIVKAQALAASTTADFINNVGLVTDAQGNRTAQTVDFSFKRARPRSREVNGQQVDDVVEETVDLTVPLLTILNVPFIRVAKATIDFEAKISSQTVDTSESAFDVGVKASGGFFGVSVAVNVSYNHHKSTSSDTVNRSAVLTVHVEAVQDELPGGLTRVLDILETAVNDSVTTPA